jgi:tRNA threonylcarbamoyladenosine biosynthesis protein TsaB
VKLLALDAASEQCSVALWHGDEIAALEAKADRGDGAQLLAMVEQLLAAAGLSLGRLDAIAFGRGPGAFTGLRLAASLTQGLAFAAGLPVIGVSDLRAVAQQALATPGAPPRALAVIDARMGEVYWAGFDLVAGHAQAATEEAVASPEDALAAARGWLGASPAAGAVTGMAAGAGSGFGAYPQLRSALAGYLQPILIPALPHAREIASLAAHDGLGRAVPAEQALPVYVRNRVATPSGAVAPAAGAAAPAAGAAPRVS